jgi:hypothetical protein
LSCFGPLPSAGEFFIESKKAGLDQLSDKEIEAEIVVYRRSKK